MTFASSPTNQSYRRIFPFRLMRLHPSSCSCSKLWSHYWLLTLTPLPSTPTLVWGIIISHLDHCCSILLGALVPEWAIWETIPNTKTREIFLWCNSDGIISLPKLLPGLPISSRLNTRFFQWSVRSSTSGVASGSTSDLVSCLTLSSWPHSCHAGLHVMPCISLVCFCHKTFTLAHPSAWNILPPEIHLPD